METTGMPREDQVKQNRIMRFHNPQTGQIINLLVNEDGVIPTQQLVDQLTPEQIACVETRYQEIQTKRSVRW